MLRLTAVIPTFEQTTSIQVQLQSVRWKRKPRWLGTAKTKVFRVPEPRKIPDGEAAEVLRLHNNYRTQLRAVRKYIIAAFEEKKKGIEKIVSEETEAEDFLHCSAINDAWNKQVAVQRQARLAEEQKAREEEILQKLLEKQERDALIMKQVEESVRKMKVEAVTFIDETTIDKAIEEALASPTDHGSTITVDGVVHQGGDPQASEVKKQVQALL